MSEEEGNYGGSEEDPVSIGLSEATGDCPLGRGMEWLLGLME